MSEANGLPSERSEHFEPFVDRLRGHVEAAEAGALTGLFADAPKTPDTAAAGQVPHWLFAMGDTLPANAFRALALLATHSEPRIEALRELATTGDAPGATALAGSNHMRACVHEAMRLWPTTPLLSRETAADVELAGETIPAGTQVLFSNLFHHRDRDNVAFADRFAPEEWTQGDAGGDRSFNHFGNGPQGCPGVNLVMLVATASLAEVLTTRDVRLTSPKLDPEKPLPHMLDFFALRFELR